MTASLTRWWAPDTISPTPRDRAAASVVEPTISVKSTVTCLRAPSIWAAGQDFPGGRWGRPGVARKAVRSRATGAGATAVRRAACLPARPQFRQNLAVVT
jgi:hypothetical protein